MTLQTSAAAEYIRSINDGDTAAFTALFADDALVCDAGRELRGREAIARWGDSDIFAVNVRLAVLQVRSQPGETVVTAKVDGDFDRTGLPDPLIIDHHFQEASGKIVRLRCQLATSTSQPSRGW
jgi:hypothetical protein